MEEVAARCGRCAQRFPLVELVADEASVGRCPLCREPLLGDYAAVAVPLVTELLAATAQARRAAARLQEVAALVGLEQVVVGGAAAGPVTHRD